MLLPEGVVQLRADLGDFLKRHRQGKLEGVAFGTQAQIAARVGVMRQTLSDIERGAAWPGPATLDALLDILNLGWEHVAHPIKSDADPRTFVNDMPGGGRLTSVPSATAPERHRAFLEGAEGNQIIALGERIRSARKRAGVTLAESAQASGISAALLSRLERGQLRRSSVFGFTLAIDPPDRPQLVIRNAWLAQLVGRMEWGEEENDFDPQILQSTVRWLPEI